jgi:FAD/FMN-containing dehydrogenase
MRLANVLSLGGTFFWAPKTGFTCDNVISLTVVLASGESVTASDTQNSDLFTALKGGSNNFGIVTSFTFKTFSLGAVWSGNVIYTIDTAPQNIQAFSKFISAPNFDQNASLMQTFGFSGGFAAVVNALVYADGVVNPPSLQGFTSIGSQVQNTMAISDLNETSYALDASSPYGSL